MNRFLRLLLLLIGLGQLFIAVGFIIRLPQVVQLWPLPYTSNTAMLFIASFIAAGSAALLFATLTEDHSTVAGLFLAYSIVLLAVAILAFQMSTMPGNRAMRGLGIACAVGFIFSLGLFLWSQRIPWRDTRPIPRGTKVILTLVTAALLLVGGALVLKTPNILPWNMGNAAAGVIYGWMFVGAAAYCAYGILRAGWGNAAGQLLALLVYDLVLIGPFLTMLPTINEAYRLNLMVYMLVVVGTGTVAIYYLILNPATRLLRRQPALKLHGQGEAA